MMMKLLPAAVVALLLLAGCQETPNETAKDVAAARQDYAETDKDALKKLTVAEADAMVKTANADFEIANAQATGRADVAKQACGTLTGVEKDACISNAEANLAAELATAVANRDAMLVAAEHHE